MNPYRFDLVLLPRILNSEPKALSPQPMKFESDDPSRFHGEERGKDDKDDVGCKKSDRDIKGESMPCFLNPKRRLRIIYP